MTEELQHFVDLARRGRHNKRTASGGELRAANLSQLVIENVLGLDSSAIAGLVEFITLTSQQPSRARELVEER